MKPGTYSRLMLGLTLCVYSVCSIGQTNPLFNYIPEDATTVIHIDLNRLYSKSPAENIKNNPLFIDLMNKPNSPWASILSNPSGSGIDFSAGVLVTLKEKTGNEFGGRERKDANFFFKLNNATQFSSHMQKLSADGNKEIRQYGTDHVVVDDSKMAAAWNNEVFVIASMPDDYSMWSVEDDTVALSAFEILKRKELAMRDRRHNCFRLLTAKPGNQVSKEAHFVQLMKQEADIKVWGDQSKLPVPEMGPLAILKNFQRFKSQKSTAVINFENGKISMHGKNYPDPLIAEVYRQFQSSSQNGELMRKIPPDNLLGMISVSMDPNATKTIMQMAGFQNLYDSIKHQLPVDLDFATLSGAFKPNMLMAVSLNEKLKDDPAAKKFGGFEVLAAIPIADKAKFEMLREKLIPFIDSIKRKNPEKTRDVPVLRFNDEFVVMALAPPTAEAFLYNPAPGEAPSWIHEFNQYPVVMNFNFRKLFQLISKSEKMDNINTAESAMVNSFDQVYLYGGNYNAGAIEMNMEFRFTDKEKNALSQLFDLLTKINK